MKHLLLFFLFSGSLDGFSQVFDLRDTLSGRLVTGVIAVADPSNPDTLRATLIVYYDKGPAILHTKPGFVVRVLRTAIGSERYYDEVYLDDKKRVVKAPWEVFSYKLKK